MHNDDLSARVAPRRDVRSALRTIERRPWQRSLRWQAPPVDRRTLVIGLVVGVLVCILQWVGFGLGMRPHPYEPERPRDAVRVNIIETAAEFPIPPEPQPPPFERRISKIRVAPPEAKVEPPPPARDETDTDAMRARIGDAGAAGVRLFNPDGSIRLATPPADATDAPHTPQAQARARWAEIEQRGDNPLDCKRTRFAEAWKPDLSAGDAFASKYLKYIGLADPEAIAHRAKQRADRAAAGCDP